MDDTIPLQAFFQRLRSAAHFLYVKCFELHAESEDERRVELMLNVVLWASFALWFASEVNLIESKFVMGSAYNGTPPALFLVIGLFFGGLIGLSRLGYRTTAAYGTVGVYLCAISLASYRWGVSLPAALLGFAMVITISGVLISSRFALFTTFLCGVVVITLGYAETHHSFVPDTNWKHRPLQFRDAVEYSVLLGFSAVLAWLSNRQTEASLVRARKSEHQLAVERDTLEVTVEARTAEVKRIQSERVAQVYRFVEFGRLASGLYHDLANHVGAVNMTLGAVQSGAHVVEAADVSRTKSELDHAFVASKRLESFVDKMKRELNGQQPDVPIDLALETSEILQLMGKKAERCGAVLVFSCPTPIFLSGNPLKVHQVITNFVSNAIDSYAGAQAGVNVATGEALPVFVTATCAAGKVTVTVQDRGCGIEPANLPKIFEPFFTTKGVEAGSGIGLAHTKDIVEKELHGSIAVQSEVGVGTTFTVEFPIQQPEQPLA